MFENDDEKMVFTTILAAALYVLSKPALLHGQQITGITPVEALDQAAAFTAEAAARFG